MIKNQDEKPILAKGDELPMHMLGKRLSDLFGMQDKYIRTLGRKPSVLWFYDKDIQSMNSQIKDKVSEHGVRSATELVYKGIPIKKHEEGAGEQQEKLF